MPRRRDAEDDLTGEAERFPGRRDHGELRCRSQERVDDADARGEHVLAVVEHEEQPAIGDEVGERLERRLAGEGADVERGGDGILDVLVAGDGGKLDETRHRPRIRPRPRG